MKIWNEEHINKDLLGTLKIDCMNCTGLCCVALYFVQEDGFPCDKKAGTPCGHLNENFHCDVHKKLEYLQFKGCMAYDCFGAGQKVSSLLYKENWKKKDLLKNEIFTVFERIEKIHQILMYLIQASLIQYHPLIQEMNYLIQEGMKISLSNPEVILSFSIEDYQNRANQILKRISINLCKAYGTEFNSKTKNLLGQNFKGQNLKGKDFTMAFLIGANMSKCNVSGANFLGADVRDLNVKDTDLSQSIFLTQMQINAMYGNKNTKIPFFLNLPSYWK